MCVIITLRSPAAVPCDHVTGSETLCDHWASDCEMTSLYCPISVNPCVIFRDWGWTVEWLWGKDKTDLVGLRGFFKADDRGPPWATYTSNGFSLGDTHNPYVPVVLGTSVNPSVSSSGTRGWTGEWLWRKDKTDLVGLKGILMGSPCTPLPLSSCGPSLSQPLCLIFRFWGWTRGAVKTSWREEKSDVGGLRVFHDVGDRKAPIFGYLYRLWVLLVLPYPHIPAVPSLCQPSLSSSGTGYELEW